MQTFQIEDLNNKGPRNMDVKFYVMAFVNFTVATGFSYIVPFYPVLAHQEAQLDYTMIGVLMSINSVGSTLSAYVFGSMIQMWGRKRFLLISLFCQSIVMLLYALVYFITDQYWLFIGVSVIMRMSEGVVRSIYAVTTFNYLNIFWKSTFAQKFSMMETTSSLGQIVGPVLGSLLNYCFGYWMPLLGMSVVFLICMFLSLMFIPPDDVLVFENKAKQRLPLNLAFSHRETLITFITLVVTRATLIYFNSFFSHHMMSYQLDENIAALILSLPQFAQILATIALPRIFKSQQHFEFLQSLSVAVSFIGAAILCPVWVNGGDFHHVYIGMLIMGLGSALNRLPAIPVLQLSLKSLKLPSSHNQIVSDMAGALFQMNMSMSNLTFPLMGGGLYDMYGGNTDNPKQEFEAFRWTMLTLVVVQVVVFVVDLTVNKSWKVWFRTFKPEVREHTAKLVGESKHLIKTVSQDSETYSVADTTSSFHDNDNHDVIR